MVSNVRFMFQQSPSTLCVLIGSILLSCLIACDEPESIEPPSSPYDRAAIEANVLSPNGDLLALEPERIGALVVAIASGDGQSAQLFMDSIFAIIDSVSDLGETSEQGLTIVQHALQAASPVRQTQQSISIAGQANAWVEIRYECGGEPNDNEMNGDEEPNDDEMNGGSISLTVFASTDSGVSDLRPVGIAWGTASACTLWTDDSNTIVDGDFAVVLPEGNAPTLFKFVGTQTNTETTDLDYEGYAVDLLMGIVVAEDNERFTVATSPEAVVINDCHGQWSCDQEASRCAYTTDANDGFISSCTAPNVLEVTW
mgnify:CR=1 FL=1